MAQVFEKRLKYVGNDVDLWELSKIYGKWLKYLTNGLNSWELTQRFWEMAKIFLKWLKIYRARFKYLRNGIGMLKRT